jgi:hypothetical protein
MTNICTRRNCNSDKAIVNKDAMKLPIQLAADVCLGCCTSYHHLFVAASASVYWC